MSGLKRLKRASGSVSFNRGLRKRVNFLRHGVDPGGGLACQWWFAERLTLDAGRLTADPRRLWRTLSCCAVGSTTWDTRTPAKRRDSELASDKDDPAQAGLDPSDSPDGAKNGRYVRRAVLFLVSQGPGLQSKHRAARGGKADATRQRSAPSPTWKTDGPGPVRHAARRLRTMRDAR